MNDLYLPAISYLDDLHLLAHSISSAESMLSELVHELADLGLSLAPDKLPWMGETLAEEEEAGTACILM